MTIMIASEADMKEYGRRLGALCVGGEHIELIGDVGAGKTTLAKGIAVGLGVNEDVQSPSFTISRVYEARNALQLAHYDFYRLHDAGIMAEELRETLSNPHTITIIEWAKLVESVLPADHLTITITATGDTVRDLELTAGGVNSRTILESMA